MEVHTIRYWEEEFRPLLDPIRTDGGQRRYGPEHLLVLHRIRTLLRDELLTIPRRAPPPPRGEGRREAAPLPP